MFKFQKAGVFLTSLTFQEKIAHFQNHYFYFIIFRIKKYYHPDQVIILILWKK
jgi:hypothetical protein